MRLTNYYEHAGDNRYYVFEFSSDELANEFETLLSARNVVFERHFDAEESRNVLFGIHRDRLRDAMWCNNMVYAKHRKPFISNTFFRWFVLLFTVALIALAVVGYFKSH
jgi:hypothetical protein